MKLSVLKLLVPAASLSCALMVTATPVLIDSLDLSDFPQFGDGNVQSGIENAIEAWNDVHDPDLPLTGIGATPDVKLNQGDVVEGSPSFGDNTLSITLGMGDYNYVFFHWGGPNVDAFYKNPQLYYIGGETGFATFTAPIYSEVISAKYYTGGPNKGQIKEPEQVKEHQYGLSFYSYYSEIPAIPSSGDAVPVSDHAMPLVLLGAGVFGIAALRHALRNR